MEIMKVKAHRGLKLFDEDNLPEPVSVEQVADPEKIMNLEIHDKPMEISKCDF